MGCGENRQLAGPGAGIEILGTPEETEQAWRMIEEGLD